MTSLQPKRPVSALIASMALVMLTSCGGGGSEEPLANFCGETETSDPVLSITAVASSATHAAVPQVLITGLSLDGVPVSLPYVIYPGRNTLVTDAGLHCTVPCGFGLTPGRYEFSVSAAGYTPATVSTRADYLNRVEGCVTRLSGSTPIALELAPI